MNVPPAALACADKAAKKAKREGNASIFRTLCPFLLNDGHATELTVWAGGALRLYVIHFVDRTIILHHFERGLPPHAILFLKCLVDGRLNLFSNVPLRPYRFLVISLLRQKG